MKRRTKKKFKKLAQGLTDVLLEILSGLGSAYDYMLFDYYHRCYPSHRSYSKPMVRSTLNRLKKQGIVTSSKQNGKVSYRLTISGKTKVLIKRILLNKKRSKDGFSTVVIFDIPEEKSRIRLYLRRLLLKNGFMNLQKSVMISPYEMPKEFFDLLTELGIRQSVSLMKSKIIYS